jgi:ABC-type nickel/cobalt efflux system permease component RcnA
MRPLATIARRARLVAALAALAAAATLALPAAAGAHPLGNFTINHQARVAISDGRVDVAYVLDQAEIPTFQERGQRGVLARKRAEIARGLALEVGGRPVPLRPGAGRIAFPRGQGGLPTTRVELALSARTATAGRTVRLRDRTFAGRAGWMAIVAVPGRGTAVRSSVPAQDPTARLTRYPQELLDEPADQRAATFTVRAGAGTVTAPRAGGRGSITTSAAPAPGATAGAPDRGGDGFAGLLDGGAGLSLLLLAAAFGWGAVHALSPGHGKAMVAAYLVGTRGTPRHAVALGLTVTVTHTIGVFALGVVTLGLSAWVVPEDLYPWLNLAAGLLVAGVGASVLRTRLRARRAHHHHHHHHPPGRITWRGLMAMGASAGLVPCPSALVVLLAAIAQHQVALGLVLIVAFSAGLAGTLTALGLAVVWSGRALGRLPLPQSAVAALPTASALAIVTVGCLLTMRALSGIG